METLKYCKVRKVKSLVRAHPEDAGIDFYIPDSLKIEDFEEKCNITNDYVFTTTENGYIKKIILSPGQSVLIPSGIHARIPHGYALIFFNKSGQASRKHITVMANTVDETYSGEMHLNVCNVGSCNIEIFAGEKLVQGIVLPINYCQVEEINSLEDLYKDFESTRCAGGFGSSGIQ